MSDHNKDDDNNNQNNSSSPMEEFMTNAAPAPHETDAESDEELHLDLGSDIGGAESDGDHKGSDAEGSEDEDAGRDFGGSDEDNFGGENVTTGRGSGGDGDPDAFSDEALGRIVSKSEAKALGRSLYKRWKALRKRSKKIKNKKHRRGEDGKKRKEKKTKKAMKRRRHEDDEVDEARGGRGKAKRTRREKRLPAVPGSDEDDDLDNYFHDADNEDDDAPLMDPDDMMRAANATRRSRRGGKSSGGTNPTVGEAKVKKLTADAQRSMLRSIATSVVTSMREARLKDEMEMKNRRPPLHRVTIKDFIIAQCRREPLRPFLIEEGILQEFSTWLYDFARRELAALELRTAALDTLLDFPIDGEVGTELIARNGDEILDAFTGMTREHLIHTDLGSAVNAVRQDRGELHTNRSKSVRLLERLSRAMAGGVRSARGTARRPGDNASTVTWKCQNDPTVAPPFHTVHTGTEVFQRALVRPDPLDPMSYLRVPPRRVPKTYVTNLAGNVGVEEK